MKKTGALLAAVVLSMSALTACGKGAPVGENEPKGEVPEFTLPENILGAADPMVPDTVAVDKYNIPESEGIQFVKNLKLGWNLGNTFDASDCDSYVTSDLEYEKAWCGAYTTIDNIAAIKAAGFQTVRIPVSWHNHVDENFKINEEWMNRVKELVDWCFACDLYVIVNTHHDVAEDFYYPDSAHLESSKQYLTTIWTQMAEAFKDYGDHLVLESLNEPRLVGTNYEWWIDKNNDQCKDAISCINTLNQLFVDTVRGVGGCNETRYLLCPGYAASPDGVLNDGFVVPTDAQNRVILSVHSYTPYNFALNTKGTDAFSLENPADTNEILNFMDSLYGKYIQNGQPVLIGEFGSLNKDNLEVRVQHAAFYVAAARARGMSCCWWDNNAFTGSGENFGLLFRKTSTFTYPQIAQALAKFSE